jgi:hypothetical protein
MPQKAIQERSRTVARGGMDDELGRFVDDQKGCILVDDVKIHLLGVVGAGGRGRNEDGDEVSSPDLVGGGLFCPIDRDEAFVDDLLNPGAGKRKTLLGKIMVEPFLRFSRIYLKHARALLRCLRIITVGSESPF